MKTVVTSVLLLAASSAQAATQVSDLQWLTGTWIESKDGVITREMWLAPLAGLMTGADQTNAPGRKPESEYMAISAEPAGVTFTAIVGHQPPTPFVLKPGTASKAVFENLGHDFPQRVIYWRCGQGNADLCARIEGMVGGKLQGQEWHYHPGTAVEAGSPGPTPR